MTGTPGSSELARMLGDLAVDMQNQRDADAVLRTIVNGAVAIIPGVRGAGVSLVSGRAVTPHVPTNPLVAELDALQSNLDAGPCLTAARERRTVHIEDMSQPTQWPRFAEAALQRGVRAMLSFHLFVERDTFGALNLYGGHAGIFDDESFIYGEILAQHASVAIAGAQAAEQFHRAIASRDAIGQAKGIIMERFKVDSVRAFAMLTKLSQDSNVKLVTVAQQVIDTTDTASG